MKSSSIGSDYKRRHKIILELVKMKFSIVVLIANKRKFFQDSILATNKKVFIKYLHRDLYETMYLYYPRLNIIEDQHGEA